MSQIAGNAAPKREKMSEGELKGILNAKVTNSLGYYGGKLSKTRVTALQYYQGEPFGNEQDGRSQVVSRDVAEAVDSMMPSLMKIFTAGEEVVRFDPTGPDDEEKAKQATEYVNWIWSQQNDGFENTYAWFKDALLNRTGAIKIWWDEQQEVAKETYKGLTDQEFALLMEDEADEDLDLVSHDEYPDPDAPPIPPADPNPMAAMGVSSSAPVAPPGAAGGIPPAAPPALPPMPNAGGQMGEPAPIPPPMLHDVVVRRTNKTGRVRVSPLPGEEFLMDRRAVSLDDTPFCAHRQKKTISDLIEMGYDYDLVKDLGEGDSSDFNAERLERFHQEDEQPYRTGNNYDPSMREVWITECYLKVDYDGDGIAELRKITFAGESGNFAPGSTVILDNEEIDDHPFAALTPIPMPHKFYGMSIADQTMDIQLIKSTLWRGMLDNMYNSISPPIGVVDGQVNLDDLLTRKVGGIVRVKRADALVEIPNPGLGSEPAEMIAYLDQVREQRTGVRRFTAGPSEDALNAYSSTATGANLVENSTQERLELVARCFAEIGIKPAFRKILKLVSKYQQKAKIIRLREKWVPMDPREWDTEFDMTVAVGLGTGNRQQQMQGMSMLLQLDQKIVELQQGINGPLVNAENIYNKLNKLCQFMGLKTAAPYYMDPASNPQGQMPPQQKPDPQVQAAQIRAQSEQQKVQTQAFYDNQQMQLQMQIDRQKSQDQMETDRQSGLMRLALDREIAMAKIQAQREIEIMKIAANREEFNASAQLEIAKHATDAAIRKREIEGAELGEDKDRAASAMPPAPKMSKITLHRDATGRATAAQHHYDDGSSHTIQIDRLSDMPGPMA